MKKVRPMPWQSHSVEALRQEFVALAGRSDRNLSALCRRYQISRKTAYKWLARAQEEGAKPLADRSRRPHHSPERCSPEMEALVLKTRGAVPAWGGRKLRGLLLRQGHRDLPSASTITEILRRHQVVTPDETHQGPWQRFERPHPNDLWQMDFKGDFAMAQGRCYPLTILDDHSRFGLALEACTESTGSKVKDVLTTTLRRYGLPCQINVDHGPPWGYDPRYPVTSLGAWIIRLGITVSHSRPYHPQTNGKIERWHRSLHQEVILRHQGQQLDLVTWQHTFDQWRTLYNCWRTHDALFQQTPASRYLPSERPFPEHLPPVEYDTGTLLRKVDANGKISFGNRFYRIGAGLRGEPVALRESSVDGVWEVFYCHQRVTRISLQNQPTQV